VPWKITTADFTGSMERPRSAQILVRRVKEDWREAADVATNVKSSA
jgi:hypothetical protein